MITKCFTISLFVISLIQSSFTFANGMPYHEDCILNAIETINLNSEQKVKVKLLIHKAKMEITIKRHELHTICKHVDETFHSGNMNMAKIDKFAKQKEKVMGTLAKIRLHERYKIYQILNADQKAQMEQKIQECFTAHSSE